MKSIEKDNLIIIYLEPNEHILTSLEKISQQYKITTGIILSGIGQIRNPIIGYFKHKGDYLKKTFEGDYELLLLTGNIIYSHSTYQSHIHVIFGDEEKKTYGGHLLDGQVSITNEIALLSSQISLERTYSEETGLMHLHIPKTT